MISAYLKFINICLAFYCILFNIIMFYIEKHITIRTKKIITRIYFAIWLIPTSYYIHILGNSPYAENYFLRNVLAGVLLHILMAYWGYKATLE